MFHPATILFQIVTYDGDRRKMMVFEGELIFKENQCQMSEL